VFNVLEEMLFHFSSDLRVVRRCEVGKVEIKEKNEEKERMVYSTTITRSFLLELINQFQLIFK